MNIAVFIILLPELNNFVSYFDFIELGLNIVAVY